MPPLLSSRNARRLFVAIVALAIDRGAPAASDSPAAAPPAPTGNGFVVRDVRVFDGTRTIDRTDVVVRDGRIESLVRGAKAPGLPVVDGRGRTLMPGLIDAHTHTYGTAREDALRFGVTTELDMFTDWHGIADARTQRAALSRKTRADLWSAGTLATAPGGHGTEYGLPIPTLTGPREAQGWVDGRLEEGSDYVKIILEDGSAYGHPSPTLDVPTLDALVVAAHARKRLAVAHVSTEADAQHAVDAGVDGLAHVFVDRSADAATVASIRKHGTFVVATLSVVATTAGAGEGARLAKDPMLEPFLSADQKRMLDSTFPPNPNRAAYLDNAIRSVSRLHSAGVPVLAGTDAGNPATTHGATMHQELALLVRAGLTPTQALNAGTALPARLFSLGDRGRIAKGLRADLLLVDGDPTKDILATRAMVAVWKDGYRVERAVPAAERGAPAAEKVPAEPLISDFEDGTIATRYGRAWVVTTDAFIGGKSTATQAWQAGGADGSKGALRVDGTIATGSLFAWAGTLFSPGAAAQAVDFSGRDTLVFKVRGADRDYSAMVFSGGRANGAPATVRFRASSGWAEVRLPLASFPGIDPTRIRGLAFTAGAPAGDFWFEIDDVSVR